MTDNKICECGYNKKDQICTRGLCDYYAYYKSRNIHLENCEYFNCKRCDLLCRFPECTKVFRSANDDGVKYCLEHYKESSSAFNATHLVNMMNINNDSLNIDKKYEEAKQFTNIISFLKGDEQFYDMACKHQLNFLLDSLDVMKDLLNNDVDICGALEILEICPKSLDEFDHYPHFTYKCKKFGC
jgi:hypothetical protein